MSVISIGLVLAAVTAAQPFDASSWITPEDYPKAALRQRRGGYVGFRLTVSAEGKPTRCEVTYPSGHDDLDALTCQLLMRRARFTPARNSAGSNAVAVFRSSNSWLVAGLAVNPKPPSTDLDVAIPRYPDGLPYPAIATIAFAVDSTGKMLDCTPMLPQRALAAESREAADEQRVVETFGETACAQATSNLKPQAATDKRGRSIASIQTARVRFVIDASRR